MLEHAHPGFFERQAREVDPRVPGGLVDRADDPIHLLLIVLAEGLGGRPRAADDLVRILAYLVHVLYCIFSVRLSRRARSCRCHPRTDIDRLKGQYPDKFVPEERIFGHIRRGDRIFIGTACGEPQHLVQSLVDYVRANPKALFDAEILHVWTLGVAPYTDEAFRHAFRHNSFFIGADTREAVNQGLADYTPIFLSQVPELFRRRLVPIDVALIQISPPDEHGYLSLGVSVDIVKAAVRSASLLVAQVNRHMPRVHGDGFLHVERRRFPRALDEPLLEFRASVADEIAGRIGQLRRPHRAGRRHHPGRLRQHPERDPLGPGAEEAPRRPHRAADRRHRRPDARASSTTPGRP